MTEHDTVATPSRRSIAKGAAWAVPAVTIAASAPSLAASPAACEGSSAYESNILVQSGCFVSVAGANAFAGWKITNTATGAAGCPIPAGTVFTERLWAPAPTPVVSDAIVTPLLFAFKAALTTTGLATAVFDRFKTENLLFLGNKTGTINGQRAIYSTRTLTLTRPLAPGESAYYGNILDPTLLNIVRWDLTGPGSAGTVPVTGAVLVGDCSN